jgi:hypothetical protein
MNNSADVSAGYLEGERLAKVSVWTLVALGVVEIAAGQFTGSIGLTADGIDSVSDGFVSFLVWVGLGMSRKSPDEKFHFGYYKVPVNWCANATAAQYQSTCDTQRRIVTCVSSLPVSQMWIRLELSFGEP